MAARPRIALLDDNEAFLKQFAPFLVDGHDYDVVMFTSARECLEHIEIEPVDLILSDVSMPEMDGIEFFRMVQDLYPEIPVIFMTAFSSTDQAISLVKQGAFHYFEKPVVDKLELFHATIREALAKRKMLKHLASFRSGKAVMKNSSLEILGQSAGIERLVQSIEEVAKLPVTVLIAGETGTGKELVARAIHESSDRRDSGFCPVNCGALAEGILESELFGHEKGSFTGAVSRRRGLFETADQGTLFLDEISEASHTLQTKLLRVLETKCFTRIGGNSPVHSDFRILAATNRSLKEEVAAGRFRQDLFYRLNVYVIELPPLRKRREDIPLLSEFYLRRFAQKYRRKVEGFSADALLHLREYDWPGNVRELINVIERAVVACKSHLISLEHLPFHNGKAATGQESHMSLQDAEKLLIEMALRRCGGNKLRAAELLGINRKTLGVKVKNYGINDATET